MNDTDTWMTAQSASEVAPARPLVVDAFGMSDRGRKRAANEDQFLVGTLSPGVEVQCTSLDDGRGERHSGRTGFLFAVADGVGGHAGGARASELAIATLQDLHVPRAIDGVDRHRSNVPRLLRRQIRLAERAVARQASEDPRLHMMGTTLTAAVIVDQELFVAHAGDSRCYLLRDGRLLQITRDHTIVQEMVEIGVLSIEEAAHHHMRSILTNSIGGGRIGVAVDSHCTELELDDILLLCTDGLTRMVAEETIVQMLRSEPTAQRACERLIAESNRRGGVDNTTVIAARFRRG